MIQKKRTLIQALSLLALHGSWTPLLNLLRYPGPTEFKWLCNPVLSCHSCTLAWFACPIGVFSHYSGWHLIPWIALGSVLLLGVLFGRLLCGWVCPFGFLQDLLHRIPSPKFALPAWASQGKYLVLVLFVFLFLFLLGESTYISFCRACPAAALQVTIPNLLGGDGLSAASAVRLGILVAVLLLAVASERAFCKALCPIGAILAPLNLLSFWEVKMPPGACRSCRKCDAACPTAVVPSKRVAVDVAPNRALDCIVCHQCQPVCPQVKTAAASRTIGPARPPA